MGAYEADPAAPIRQVFFPCALNRCDPYYQDKFENPTSGWPVADESQYKMQYVNGEYRLFLHPKYALLTAHSGLVFADTAEYAVSVDVRSVRGQEAAGFYGLRLTDAVTGQFLFYRIDAWGGYMLQKWTDTGSSALASGSSPAILTGTATNRLALEYRNSYLTISANGQKLATGMFRLQGVPGLATMTDKHLGLDIYYDNFAIFPADCQRERLFNFLPAPGQPWAEFTPPAALQVQSSR